MTESTPSPAKPKTNAPLEKGQSLWADAFKRLLKNKAAIAGAIVILFMASCALSFPLLSRHVTLYTFDEQHPALEPKRVGARSVPSEHHELDVSAKERFDEIDEFGDGFDAFDLTFEMEKLEFAWIDANDDNELSAPELEDKPLYLEIVVDVSLELFDDDDSKTLTRDEIPDEITDETIRLADEDGDGALSASELRSARLVAACSASDTPSGGEATIIRFDEDDSGGLSIEEARTAQLISLMFGSEADGWITKYDSDDDGLLTLEEFPGLPKPQVHHFGCDTLGRDLLTRCIQGARVSLLVGFLATAVSLLIGVLWGAIAGFLGGRVDNAMMRFVDIMYGLPFMFLVILLMVFFQEVEGDKKIFLLFIALGAVQWLTMSRIVRGQVISLKKREFIEAARATGVSGFKIIVRHLIPNALGPIIVYSTLTVPAVMLEEAFLSFLGLGVQAPAASWGSLASEGAASLKEYPWMIFFPGAALAVTLLSLNFLGDGLRDALDPQTRKD